MSTHTIASGRRLWPTLVVLLAIATLDLACHEPQARPSPSPTDAVARGAPLPLPTPTRAMWVARFHYRTPEDIRTIMANCAAIGCNVVLWQVRGEGTVSYPSRLEPWSREYGHADPGFDPLAIAVAEAHRHGLHIQAYVNVMPGWKGRKPPPRGLVPEQAYHAHPGWFMHDAQGRRQPLGDFYVILNPCNPDVRAHIAALVAEIVTNYDVDGVHLDYVRYAWDETPGARQSYPRDPQTLALYEQETGLTPDDDADQWLHWRGRQLTQLVSDLRRTVDRWRPGAAITAAVWRSPERGYNEYLQNGVVWLRTGLIDAAMPMIYSTDVADFAADADHWRQLAGDRRVIPGLGLYKHDTRQQVADQLATCGAAGGEFALFSYDSLFPTHSDRNMKSAQRNEKQRLRHLRREALHAYLSD